MILSIPIYRTQLFLGGKAVMSNPNRNNLTKRQCEVIETGILNRNSTRTIAKRFKIGPSIITGSRSQQNSQAGEIEQASEVVALLYTF